MQFIFPVITIIGVVVAIASGLKKSPFFSFVGIQVAIYGGLKSLSLIMPPLPGQVIVMFMIMSFFSFLIYFSIEEETLQAFIKPLRALLADDDKKVLRFVIVYLLVPLLAGYITFLEVKPTFEPPLSPRITHPEPPTEIDFRGNTIKILGLENPLRKDPAAVPGLVQEGKVIYFQNCFFCHGADLDGRGNFAQAFNPPPPPFRGTDTIAQLPESYVFWRVAKGWTGLPAGATPWDSAMPAFENLLTQDQIWKVILYIYDATGNKPRTW
ncbi:MAG TPA: cytochrome c [Nitrospirota bacterium]|nr:cytochrome c [Nitrospirota bacterium]